MKDSDRTGAERFRAEVAGFLELPANSNDSAVRKALRSKGLPYIRWYEKRLGAIAEFERSVRLQAQRS